MKHKKKLMIKLCSLLPLSANRPHFFPNVLTLIFEKLTIKKILIVTSPITQHTQLFYDPLSGTTRVNRYQKKHSPTDTYLS